MRGRKRQRKKNRTKPRITLRQVRFWRRKTLSLFNPLVKFDCETGGWSGEIDPATGHVIWTEIDVAAESVETPKR